MIADLAIRVVWLHQAEALFDVRVIDTDAQSYSNYSPKEVLRVAEGEKKNRYRAACEAHRAQFTPIAALLMVCLVVRLRFFSKELVRVCHLNEGNLIARQWDE